MPARMAVCVCGAAERVGLAAAAAVQEEPIGPVTGRGQLGVAGGEDPVVGSAAAALDQPSDEGL
jgi:hypothetical protein